MRTDVDSGGDAFAALLQDAVDETASEETASVEADRSAGRVRHRSNLLLTLSVGAGMLGVAAIAFAVIFGAITADPAPVEAVVQASEAPVEAEEPDPGIELAEAGDASGVDPSWLSEVAERTGIPERALEGYASAANRIAQEQPGCGLGWNTLAGIGFVESEHGTIHGSTISSNGIAAPPIRGIALDGTSTKSIPDTDGGEFDHDTVWDRAVGPMQFIPSTWVLWASDGDGDGISDPQNIDDSAYAAGRYLCSVGGDLTQAENWIAAVAAYNDTVEYNNLVADAADHYAVVSG